MPANPKAKTKRGLGCLGIFWMLWTLLVGAFDLTIAYKTFQQLRSLSFKPVVAVLDKSKVEPKSDGEGTSYKAVVEYRYTVKGQEYRSNRLEFLDNAFGPADAQSRLPESAVGNELTAHFDPSSPEISVLRKGFRLNDLIVPIFLLPFNAISLVGLIYFLDWWWSRIRGYCSLQFRMRASGNETEFRFYKFSPLLAAIMAAGAAGFVMSFFVIVLPRSWIDVNVRIVIALFLIVSASSGAYLKSSRYYTEISINHFKNELIYGIFGSREEGTGKHVPLIDSHTLQISEKESTDSDGDTSVRYLLSLNSAAEKLIDLHEYQYLEDAEQMAGWLSKFGLSI